jgi:L-malate glycosyltransferase
MTRPGLAYVVNSLNPGGTEKLAVEMALAFSGEFRVCVFCLDEPGHWAGELRARGIPVHCVWRVPGLDVRMPVRLARLMRRFRADIVHAHQCTPWFYSALARLLYRRPALLLEEHGRFYPEEDRLARRVFNRVLIARLTSRFVAVSEDVRRRLQRYEGLDARRIEVIYNGVAAGERLSAVARTVLRRSCGLGEEDFVVGTVGRFDPIKNLPMLIAAIGGARASNPRVHGLLVGDGPELPAIRELIGRHGLEQTICLTGFRDDARTLVQCMDLFVLSSLSEGTSMALLEAIQAAVPVAVTAVGGNPEIVHSGATGWVIESEATDSLAAAILEAAADPTRCRRSATAGLQQWRDRFSFDKMIASYRSLYHSLLLRPGAIGVKAGLRPR